LTTSSFTAIQPQSPDSPVHVTVAADTTVKALIQAEGDITLTASFGSQALVEVHLVVDNVIVRSVRTSAVNYPGFAGVSSAWHLGTILTLQAGSHDVHVEAATVTSTIAGATANGAAPGNLSVAVFKQ